MTKNAQKLASQLCDGEGFLITNPKNILYYSGFDGEGLLFIKKDEAIIITDFRYVEAAKNLVGNFKVENIADGIENIIEKKVQTIIIEENDLTVSAYRAYQKKLSWAEFEDGAKRINEPRLVKSAEEIAKIKTAADIATQALIKVIENIKIGVSEREIALMFEMLVKKAGASALSFDTIVASGSNSSMPHAGVTDRKFAAGDFITIDFGCVYEGYCSDMTRTFALKSVSDEQKNVYEVVKRAQSAALEAAVSGAKCLDVDAAARDIIAKSGYGKFFGHALGHGVGLNIHEEPRLSTKSEQILSDGMVVTCEPGIYIEGKFGVRIEDLIVINSQKCTNLSNFTKELIIL